MFLPRPSKNCSLKKGDLEESCTIADEANRPHHSEHKNLGKLASKKAMAKFSSEIEQLFCGCGNSAEFDGIRMQRPLDSPQGLETFFQQEEVAPGWTESHPWMAALKTQKMRSLPRVEAPGDSDEWAELPKMVEQAARRVPRNVSTSVATRLAVLTRDLDDRVEEPTTTSY